MVVIGNYERGNKLPVGAVGIVRGIHHTCLINVGVVVFFVIIRISVNGVCFAFAFIVPFLPILFPWLHLLEFPSNSELSFD